MSKTEVIVCPTCDGDGYNNDYESFHSMLGGPSGRMPNGQSGCSTCGGSGEYNFAKGKYEIRKKGSGKIEVTYDDNGRRIRSKPASGGGCYLTTACVHYKGLSDDCEELTLLRAFRDGYLLNAIGGKELIDEYYIKAPLILDKINNSPTPFKELEYIYEQVLNACSKIKNSAEPEALSVYKAMVEYLWEKYKN